MDAADALFEPPFYWKYGVWLDIAIIILCIWWLSERIIYLYKRSLVRIRKEVKGKCGNTPNK